MRLSVRQQCALNVIERDITAAEPKLAMMFGIFASLAQGQPLPGARASGDRFRRIGRQAAMLAIAATRRRLSQVTARNSAACAPRPPTWVTGSPWQWRSRPAGPCPVGHELRPSDIVRDWQPCLCRHVETGALGHHVISCAICLNQGRPAGVYKPDCRHRPADRAWPE